MKKIIFCFLIYTISLIFQINANAEEPKTKTISDRSFQLGIASKYNARKYFLGPNDVLSIDVFGIEEFSQDDVKIKPDGKVLFRPFEPIMASGLTVEELQALLTEKYKYYVKNPKISIRIMITRPFISYVTGAVINPGSYEIITDTTQGHYVINSKPDTYIDRKTPLLSNILVAAGGIEFDADIEHIQIKNTIDGSQFEVNLLKLLENGDNLEDLFLMPGDNIHVPRLSSTLAVSEEKFKKFAGATFSPKTMPVKIYGFVNKPGLVELDATRSIDLMSAITAAGGFIGGEGPRPGSGNPPKKIYISRTDNNGKLATKVVNPLIQNVTLLPNDIVYVPDRTAPRIGRGFDYFIRIFAPFHDFANTVNNWDIMFNNLKN